jgi:hypothetical protein
VTEAERHSVGDEIAGSAGRQPGEDSEDDERHDHEDRLDELAGAGGLRLSRGHGRTLRPVDAGGYGTFGP